MVVCHAAKKVGYREKTAFSYVHSSMDPCTPFLHYSCPPDRVLGHTANLIKFAPAICVTWVFKILI